MKLFLSSIRAVMEVPPVTCCESPPSLKVCMCLQAVENPSCNEIRDVLVAAGLNVYAEVREQLVPHVQ